MNIEGLRDQIRELVNQRLLAREHVEGAIVEVQRALLDALDGERLRLHNLSPRRDAPYRGVVLRGKYPDRRFDPDDRPSQLVLRDDGRLVVAWIAETGEVDDRPLRIEDLDAEDLPGVVDRVIYALQHHSARVGEMSSRYEEIGALARRVTDALARKAS